MKRSSAGFPLFLLGIFISLWSLEACGIFDPPPPTPSFQACHPFSAPPPCASPDTVLDSFQYVVRLNTPDKLDCVKVALNNLEHEIVRQCNCETILLMYIPPHINPNETTPTAQTIVDENGGGSISRNYLIPLGPWGNLPDSFPSSSSNNLPPAPGPNDVVVAVIDMGVDYKHRYICPNAWSNPNTTSDGDCINGDEYSYNFKVNNGIDTDDNRGHGSHVAGIITLPTSNADQAYTNKSRLKIMSLKISQRDESSTDLFSATCAIDYAVRKGANILNLSWGYYHDEPDLVLRDALLDAQNAGVLVVTSSGNDGRNTDICQHWPSGFSNYPGFKNVISVSAIEDPSTDVLSAYSNYGENTVQYVAIGNSVLSTLPTDQIGYKCGTSMAAPIVSRAAAIAWIQNGNSTYNYQDAINALNLIAPPISTANMEMLNVRRISFTNSFTFPSTLR